jgi:hypothetical protein
VDGFVTIVKLEQLRPGWTRVHFDNGQVRDLEWGRFANEGKLYEPLADPAFAAQCQIAYDGDALLWPNGMDWSAGAVLEAGQKIRAERRPRTA